MLHLRKSAERGQADHGWLKARHSFSFGQYHDPRFMGYGPLRVINEDRIAPGAGFATHSHKDMEILTFILEGALEHKDSQGGAGIIRPGEVQRMSAGTGIAHSEFNASKTEPVHLLQIWMLPERAGLPPGYEQKAFAPHSGSWRLLGAPDGRDGAVTIHQDIDLYTVRLGSGESTNFSARQGRKLWVQITRGSGLLHGLEVAAGDGAAIEQEAMVRISTSTAPNAGIEALLFDMRS